MGPGQNKAFQSNVCFPACQQAQALVPSHPNQKWLLIHCPEFSKESVFANEAALAQCCLLPPRDALCCCLGASPSSSWETKKEF